MAGKVAIITGGGRGIGARTAELFCAHQAKVLLVDQDAGALRATASYIRERQPKAQVEVAQADVADYDQALRAVRLAREKLGDVNVLVNNAAFRSLSTIADADNEQWERVLAINLIGSLNFCKATLPALRSSGHGSVVNVSSCYAIRGRKGFAAYDASKAGLLAMTRTLAVEEAEHGVRVNAVCPGGTLTPFTIAAGQARGLSEAQMRAEIKADSLFKRWAEEKEAAYPILWLASDEASYVTGATLMVDGGASIM